MQHGGVRSFARQYQRVTGLQGRKGSMRRAATCLLLSALAGVVLLWVGTVASIVSPAAPAGSAVTSTGAATGAGAGAYAGAGAGTDRLRQQHDRLALTARKNEGEEAAAAQKDEDEDEDDGPKLSVYGKAGCEGEPIAVLRPSDDHDDHGDGASGAGGLETLCGVRDAKSMRLTGAPEADFFSSCDRENHYAGSLFASEGCVARYNYPVAKSVKFRRESSLARPQISAVELATQWAAQDHRPFKPAGAPAKARIVFSCESAEYFGYQVWANYFGFLTSGQSSATWTRLLTGRRRDDLAAAVPGLATFQAKRSLYSRRYSPINKPDVIAKWFASPDRPTEEVIVVIDPDNWLLRDLAPYVAQVSPGRAVGEPAYYHGSTTAQRLWKAVCRKNCEVDVDLVGVPYLVHRDDLARIAPLWRSYTIMLKDRMDKDEAFKTAYGHLDLSWAAEMFGYNFASAHVGVRHTVVPRIQVRDVDGEHRKERLEGKVSMLHVGRAWFPQSYAPAQRWAHTEGKSFNRHGQQVWCKCNHTASTVMPWPVPPEADFQSTKTLELMHYANERFGPIPRNPKFRRGSGKGEYHVSED